MWMYGLHANVCTCFPEFLLSPPCFCKTSVCLSEGDIFRVAWIAIWYLYISCIISLEFSYLVQYRVPSSVIYLNELTIAAISEYMKEMETSSLPIFISSHLYSLLICIWLESHPHRSAQVGVAGEGSAAQQCSPHSGCGCSSAFPLQGCHKGCTSTGMLNWTGCRISSCFFGICNLTLLPCLCRLCLLSKLPFSSSTLHQHLPSESRAECWKKSPQKALPQNCYENWGELRKPSSLCSLQHTLHIQSWWNKRQGCPTRAVHGRRRDGQGFGVAPCVPALPGAQQWGWCARSMGTVACLFQEMDGHSCSSCLPSSLGISITAILGLCFKRNERIKIL